MTRFRLAYGRNAVDRSTDTVCGVYVVRRAADATRGARWVVRHPCGHERIVSASHLATSESRKVDLTCPICRVETRQQLAQARATESAERTTPRRVCRHCGKPGHTPVTCELKLTAPSPTEPCRRCAGLPWRRPKRGICRCKEHYAPEPRVTAADVHAWPVENRTVLVT